MKNLFVGAVLAAIVGTWLVVVGVALSHFLATKELREACAEAPVQGGKCYSQAIVMHGGLRR